MYFWRTYDGAECDLIEEADGRINALEFKINPKSSARIPRSFIEKYNPETLKIISPSNFTDLIDQL
jgi:hypothetical protein